MVYIFPSMRGTFISILYEPTHQCRDIAEKLPNWRYATITNSSYDGSIRFWNCSECVVYFSFIACTNEHF
jgi:ABC-type multidrug transport system permease subunit